MNQFQTAKAAELANFGFLLVSSEYLAGASKSKQKDYIFKFESEAGRKAYIYPTWVQFI